MSARCAFPGNWHDLDDAFFQWLLENYKQLTLRCTRYPNPEPYQNKENGRIVNPWGYEVIITDINENVIKIRKAYSPKFDSCQGGRQSLLERVPMAFSDPDGGYCFDAYAVNNNIISVCGDNWRVAPIIDELYKAVRSRTIPTANQKRKREAQKEQYKQQQLERFAIEQNLLKRMLKDGDITPIIAHKYGLYTK